VSGGEDRPIGHRDTWMGEGGWGRGRGGLRGGLGLRALGGLALVVRGWWAIVELAFAQGDHLGPEPGVRGQHSVMAMAVDTWWRDEA